MLNLKRIIFFPVKRKCWANGPLLRQTLLSIPYLYEHVFATLFLTAEENGLYLGKGLVSLLFCLTVGLLKHFLILLVSVNPICFVSNEKFNL